MKPWHTVHWLASLNSTKTRINMLKGHCHLKALFQWFQTYGPIFKSILWVEKQGRYLLGIKIILESYVSIFLVFFPPPWKCISSSCYKITFRDDTQTTSVISIYCLKLCRDILMNNEFLSTVYLLRTWSPYVILSYQSNENISNVTYAFGTVLIHFYLLV